jgi:hypothetical protein
MSPLKEVLETMLTGDLTLRERVAIKLALSLLKAEPPPLWTDEEYLELPRKFELLDGELLATY